MLFRNQSIWPIFYFLIFNWLMLMLNFFAISSNVNSTLLLLLNSDSVKNLPLRYHSLLPLACTTAGPFSLWRLPLMYQYLVPSGYSTAGPSSLWSSPLMYHDLVPLEYSIAGPSSLCRMFVFGLKYLFVPLSSIITFYSFMLIGLSDWLWSKYNKCYSEAKVFGLLFNL